jgi:hypothetical protein
MAIHVLAKFGNPDSIACDHLLSQFGNLYSMAFDHLLTFEIPNTRYGPLTHFLKIISQGLVQ